MNCRAGFDAAHSGRLCGRTPALGSTFQPAEAFAAARGRKSACKPGSWRQPPRRRHEPLPEVVRTFTPNCCLAPTVIRLFRARSLTGSARNKHTPGLAATDWVCSQVF